MDPVPDDSRESSSQKKLRAEAEDILAQARVQLSEVQAALSSLTLTGVMQAKLAGAEAHLSAIVSELAQAGEAHALVKEAASAQATSTAAATPAQMAEVRAASADTRREVETQSRDLFDKHLFEPYLHFSSPEDEAEFRRREEEARRYIARQLAKHTPEGDLNASGGMLGYMLDANVHGADRSPDFMSRWNALAEKAQRQRAAMRAAGQSTDEFDHRLGESARRFLKAKGLSDAEIKQRLSHGADPLDAVKPYLGHDHAAAAISPQEVPKPRTEAGASAARPHRELTATVADLGAQLKAGGVTNTDAGATTPAHGVSVAAPAAGQTVSH